MSEPIDVRQTNVLNNTLPWIKGLTLFT